MATATAKPAETVEVELPMCPTCSRVSKMPVGYFGGKTYCHGPIGEKHKPVRMKPATFRLVEDRDDTGATA